MLDGAAFVHQAEFQGELAAASCFRRVEPEAAFPQESLAALQSALVAGRPARPPGHRLYRVAIELSAAAAAALIVFAGFHFAGAGGSAPTPVTNAARVLQSAHDRIALIEARAAVGDVAGAGSTAEEVRDALLRTEDALGQIAPDDPAHQALLSRLNIDITELDGLVDHLHLPMTPLVPLAAPPLSVSAASTSLSASEATTTTCPGGGSGAGATSTSTSTSTTARSGGSTTSTTSSASGAGKSGDSTSSTTSTTAGAAIPGATGHSTGSTSTSSTTTSSTTTTSEPGGSRAGAAPANSSAC